MRPATPLAIRRAACAASVNQLCDLGSSRPPCRYPRAPTLRSQICLQYIFQILASADDLQGPNRWRAGSEGACQPSLRSTCHRWCAVQPALGQPLAPGSSAHQLVIITGGHHALSPVLGPHERVCRCIGGRSTVAHGACRCCSTTALLPLLLRPSNAASRRLSCSQGRRRRLSGPCIARRRRRRRRQTKPRPSCNRRMRVYTKGCGSAAARWRGVPHPRLTRWRAAVPTSGEQRKWSCRAGSETVQRSPGDRKSAACSK